MTIGDMCIIQSCVRGSWIIGIAEATNVVHLLHLYRHLPECGCNHDTLGRYLWSLQIMRWRVSHALRLFSCVDLWPLIYSTGTLLRQCCSQNRFHLTMLDKSIDFHALHSYKRAHVDVRKLKSVSYHRMIWKNVVSRRQHVCNTRLYNENRYDGNCARHSKPWQGLLIRMAIVMNRWM